VTLVELMIGIAIGLIGTIAIFSVMARFEGYKRTTTARTDAQENASFALFTLERQIRSAGSGYVQGLHYAVWGCALQAYADGAARVPLPSRLPTPFETWPPDVFAAPVLIRRATAAAGASDTLQVFGGNPSLRTFRSQVLVAGATPQLDSAFGIFADDYLLNSDGLGHCRLGTAATVHDDGTVELRPAQSPPTGFTGGSALDLGHDPLFALYGVADTPHQLLRYDLLQREPGAIAVADGIVLLRALYGIDSHASCTSVTARTDSGATADVIDDWVAAEGAWSYETLTADPLSACTAFARIKAIRIALVAQSQLPERADARALSSDVTLFADLATRGLSYRFSGDPQFRYVLAETTIPIRNAFISKQY
jgi:type IV pilus assembly protein PilW